MDTRGPLFRRRARGSGDIPRITTPWALRAQPGRCGVCERPICIECRDGGRCERCAMGTCELCLTHAPGWVDPARQPRRVCEPCAADLQRARIMHCEVCGSEYELTEGSGCGSCHRDLCKPYASESGILYVDCASPPHLILCPECLERAHREAFYCPNCRLRYSGTQVGLYSCDQCGCQACFQCLRPWPGCELGRGLVCQDCYEHELNARECQDGEPEGE